MQELIAYINIDPALLKIAVVLIWGTLILVALQWFDKKQRKWTSRTTEGKEQRLRARKLIIHEYYV